MVDIGVSVDMDVQDEFAWDGRRTHLDLDAAAGRGEEVDAPRRVPRARAAAEAAGQEDGAGEGPRGADAGVGC